MAMKPRLGRGGRCWEGEGTCDGTRAREESSPRLIKASSAQGDHQRDLLSWRRQEEVGNQRPWQHELRDPPPPPAAPEPGKIGQRDGKIQRGPSLREDGGWSCSDPTTTPLFLQFVARKSDFILIPMFVGVLAFFFFFF